MAVLPLAIKYTVVYSKVENPCGRGCGPGWVDCTGTLPERIHSPSTWLLLGLAVSICHCLTFQSGHCVLSDMLANYVKAGHCGGECEQGMDHTF